MVLNLFSWLCFFCFIFDVEKFVGVIFDRLIEGEDKFGVFEGKKYNEDL